MRRPARWLLNALTVLSLLLCMAATGLWLRSYSMTDHLKWERIVERLPPRAVPPNLHPGNAYPMRVRERQVTVGRGSLIWYSDFGEALGALETDGWEHWTSEPAALREPMPGLGDKPSFGPLRFAGAIVIAGGDPFDPAAWFRTIKMPLALPAFIASILPFLRTAHWYAGRRAARRQGRCPRCSYDLTGNVSGVCPECGMRVPPLAQA